MGKRGTKIMLSVLLFALFTFLPNLDVNAIGRTPSSDNQVCVNNSIYQITEKGENVITSTIRYRQINSDGSGCQKYKNGGMLPGYGFSQKKECEEGYEFSATNLNIPCKVTDHGTGYFETCPTESDQKSITSMTNLTRSAEMTWDQSKQKWIMTMEKAQGYLVKKVTSENKTRKCLNDDCTVFGFEQEQVLGGPGSDGVLRFEIAPGEDYYFTFYLNTGSICDDSYMGYTQGTGSTYIPNPYKSSYRCTVEFPEAIKNAASSSQEIARSMMYQCTDDYIDYEKRNNYTDSGSLAEYQRVLDFIATFKLSTGVVNDSLQCSFDQSKNSNVSISSPSSNVYIQVHPLTAQNKYWRAVCTEKLVIEYEQPKGVRAGEGFSYSPVIKMERTCIPVEVRKPIKKPLCSYAVECWGGPANHHGEGGAGPNETFEECIKSCDGGEYSQSCIDSCYEEVYENETVTNMDSILKSNEFSQVYQDTVAKVADKVAYNVGYNCGNGLVIGQRGWETKLPVSSCHVQTNQSNCRSNNGGCPICYSEHGLGYVYCDTCNSASNPTKCYEVFRSGPDCSLDPEADYKKEIEASAAELANMLKVISDYSSSSLSSEKFNAKIIDSYTGNEQEYNANSKTKVLLEKKMYGDYDYSDEVIDRKQITIGDGPNRKVVTTESHKTIREITLTLDEAYLSKVETGDIFYGRDYYNSSRKPTSSGNDLGTSIVQSSYYQGGPKYYTNVNSNGVNMYERWPGVIENEEDAIDEYNRDLTQNIKYFFSSLGTWQQWSNINLDCFYGIKNCTSIILPSTCKCYGNNCGENDVEGGGITFIYRPIDLNQPFVERNPRWNWTNSAKNDRFNIDPVATTDKIKEKGYSIYEKSFRPVDFSNLTDMSGPSEDNDDLDYEIVLTKQNINNIRRYNKEKDGKYLDYDMYCYRNAEGVNICQSNFLSNSSNLYLLKRGLAGCNNQADSTTCERDY